MNRLDTMQVYVRVAELASFTQAADSLGMSKAAVSTAIRQLETGLGTRLLQRTTRRVHMTPDGMMFHERSKHMLDEMEELQTLFRHGAAELSGRLRVDMPVAVARNIVIPLLPRLPGSVPGRTWHHPCAAHRCRRTAGKRPARCGAR